MSGSFARLPMQEQVVVQRLQNAAAMQPLHAARVCRPPKHAAIEGIAAMISREALTDALHAMFELSPTPFCISSTGRPHSRYVKANSAYLDLIGRTWEEIEGASLVTVGTAIHDEARLRRHHLLDTVGFYKLEEAHIRHASGRIIPTLISAQRLLLGGQLVDIEIIIDNSAHKALEKEIIRAAFTDPVTELPNRLAFDKALDEALARWAPGVSVGLAYIDLNGFKQVNDGHGHAAGDLLLRTIGQRLRVHAAGDEVVARLGGDEFALIFHVPLGVAVTQHRFDRLVEDLCTPILIGEAQVGIGASIGVAVLDTPVDAQTLIRLADEIMYEAKRTGEATALRMRRFRA
jgi:diguanylate cyclase (GGDEF)-like protein